MAGIVDDMTGEQLKRWRERMGWTQQEAALWYGYSPDARESATARMYLERCWRRHEQRAIVSRFMACRVREYQELLDLRARLLAVDAAR